jgi:hypothetical protein
VWWQHFCLGWCSSCCLTGKPVWHHVVSWSSVVPCRQFNHIHCCVLLLYAYIVKQCHKVKIVHQFLHHIQEHASSRDILQVLDILQHVAAPAKVSEPLVHDI